MSATASDEKREIPEFKLHQCATKQEDEQAILKRRLKARLAGRTSEMLLMTRVARGHIRAVITTCRCCYGKYSEGM